MVHLSPTDGYRLLSLAQTARERLTVRDEMASRVEIDWGFPVFSSSPLPNRQLLEGIRAFVERTDWKNTRHQNSAHR